MNTPYKYSICMAALAMMGAAITACSSIDDDEQAAVPAAGKTIVLKGTLAGKASNDITRALGTEGQTAWEEGEQVAVYYQTATGHATATATIKNANGDFEATLTDPKAGSVQFVYPATRHDGQGGYSTEGIDRQDGSIETVSSKWDIVTGQGTLAMVEGKDTATIATVSMETQLSICRFTLKDEADADVAADTLTVTVGSDTYGIKPAQPTNVLYVALKPATEAATEFTATTAAGDQTEAKTYAKTAANPLTFVKGTFYTSTVKMNAPAPAYPLLSAATTADYGKVVCAAGHLHDAKTAVPTGCTAVGILGKVTETGHGLILALQDATSQNWNTINGWESETTYAGTTLKVLPDDAARGANLTSYTTLGTTAVSNWAVAQKSDYDAIFTNLGSTTGDSDGKVYNGNVNAYITTDVGGTAMSGEYWSATEKGGVPAWFYDNRYWNSGQKTYTKRVRPVLGFGGEATPALLQLTVHESQMAWPSGVGDHIIYYASGETWGQAIANHPTENVGWSIQSVEEFNFVYYGENRVSDGGSTAVQAGELIDANASYVF